MIEKPGSDGKIITEHHPDDIPGHVAGIARSLERLVELQRRLVDWMCSSDRPIWIGSGDEPKCQICGCTDGNACIDPDALGPGRPGPCAWVEKDLCSACETACARCVHEDACEEKPIKCEKFLERKAEAPR